MWVEEEEEDGISQVRYSFYEKEMNTPYCIMERSAMAERSKISSLTQDLIRRLVNTCQETTQEDKNEIVEAFIKRLEVSGYKKDQVGEIIESGLKGYITKLENAEKDGRGLHRSATSTLASRQKKKLTAKTSWYKKSRKKEEDLKESKIQAGKRKKVGEVKKKDAQNETKSILFVPRTKGGELAKRLRKEEEVLAQVTGYKVKIVERSGKMLKRILHRSNPWAGEDCQREDCSVCQGAEENSGDCKRRNITYKTTCLECKKKGKEVCYYGESARSAFERGKEHFSDYEKMSTSSHMVKHHVQEHKDHEEQLEFSMKVVRCHMTAFSRQVHEAVIIHRNGANQILNSKGEYNRCSLPRLKVMQGNRDTEKEDKEMTESELELEIRKLGWRKRWRRNEEKDQNQGPPRKKRMRWKVEQAVKRKGKEEAEKVSHHHHNHRKRRKFNHEVIAQARACDNNTQEEVTQKKKEGRIHTIFTVSDPNIKCSNVKSKISIFEKLTKKNENEKNGETSLENLLFDQQEKTENLPNKLKKIHPIFTAPFKAQVGSKAKPDNKANRTLSQARHHSRITTRGIKNRPDFNYRRLDEYFSKTPTHTTPPQPSLLPPPNIIPIRK